MEISTIFSKKDLINLLKGEVVTMRLREYQYFLEEIGEEIFNKMYDLEVAKFGIMRYRVKLKIKN